MKPSAPFATLLSFNVLWGMSAMQRKRPFTRYPVSEGDSGVWNNPVEVVAAKNVVDKVCRIGAA